MQAQPTIDLSSLSLEPHVAEALTRARDIAGGVALDAATVLLAARDTAARSRSEAFGRLAALLEAVPAASVPHLKRPPERFDVVEVTPALQASFEALLSFASDGHLWGRDLVTWVLLADDGSLEGLASEAGHDLAGLRSAWFAFVHGSGRREPEAWEAWWKAMGVETPAHDGAGGATGMGEGGFDGEAMLALGGAAALAAGSEVHMQHLIAALVRLTPESLLPALERASLTADEIVAAATPPGASPPPPTWDAVEIQAPPPGSDHVALALRTARWLADPGAVGVRHLLQGALSVGSCSVIERLARAGLTRRGLPWAPVRLAGYGADVSSGRDLLDMEHEARTLAAVMAARTVRPPLSIGLFGTWGSGKSFFMRLLQREVGRLQELQDEAFCQRVVQIRFNAWHYIDSNLWASLANEVFEQLGRDIDAVEGGGAATDAEERAERRRGRRRLLLLARTSRSELEEAEARRRRAADDLERARDEVSSLRDTRWFLRGRVEADAVAGKVLRRFLEREDGGVRRLDQVLAEMGLSPSGVDPASLQRRLEALRGRARGLAAWLGAVRSSPPRALLAGGVLALAAYVAVSPPAFLAALGTAAKAAVTLGGALAGLVVPHARKAGRILEASAPVARAFGEEADAVRAELVEEGRERVALRVRQLDRAEARERALRDQLAETEEELRALLDDQRLQTFIRQRKESDDYRKHLGVIARARQDFEQLSRLLESQEEPEEEALTPAELAMEAELERYRTGLPPIDRIVLYIDDLDRCPEDKVVDVLQAVHLLLAFKLFVVVVGVDPRWLLHSLRQRSDVFQRQGPGEGMDGTGRHWRSTPMDYLEKIFQIPFHLRPMGEQGFGAMVTAMTSPPAARTDRTGGAVPAGRAAEAMRPGEAAGPPQRTADGAEDGESPLPPGATVAATGPAGPGGDVAGPDTEPGPPEDAPSGTAGAAPTGTPDGETLAADHDRSPVPGGDERLDPAAEAAPLPPRPHLAVLEWERTAMRALHPFIDSPRSAKRFVNVYRLVRASHLEDALFPADGSEPSDQAKGEARQALVLLAMLTGHPGPAGRLFERVEQAGEGTRWSALLADLADEEAGGRGAPADGTWREFAARVRLSDEELRRRGIAFDPSVADLRRWIPRVARYSFRSGHATGRQVPLRRPPTVTRGTTPDAAAAPIDAARLGPVAPADRPDTAPPPRA